MFTCSKIVNWGMHIVTMVLLWISILANILLSGENFSAKDRRFSSKTDYSSQIEKQIRAGITSTADLIVDYHPRLWMRGNWDWDAHDQEGSFTWRFVHGEDMGESKSANDQEKYEFAYIARYGDTIYYGPIGHVTFGNRYLEVIITAESVSRDAAWNFPRDLRGTSLNPDYDPQHTEDELLAQARAKLLACPDESKLDYSYVGPYGILVASVAYDWLVNRKYSDGITPVLSEADRAALQNAIIATAESMREHAKGNGYFFNGIDISRYCYFVAGLALYEPSGQWISATNNAKAKQYLDEFDEYWVRKILPVLNEQGGTGGWHAGLASSSSLFYSNGSINSFNYRIAPFLFAHYTATGQSFENSVFSTGALKYTIEFQNHMVYPNGEFGVGKDSGNRYQWIAPLFVTSRRRFSSDPEQQWLGELAGWFRNEVPPNYYVDAGSYCMFDQLMWEEKWPNPRSANELGCGTRHFAKLGWVAMRSGFTSPNDLAALFINQRYHWSEADLYAQNSFHIMRKGWLVEGNRNTIYIDGQYQRTISGFPMIKDGVEAYSPGSVYDVGPGIQNFESTDQYDYMFGDATNAYDKNKLEKFTRGFVWIKANNTFIIFDRVVTKDAGIKKSWIIDPGAIPQTEGDRLVKISNGAGALWVKRLLPEQATESMSDTKFEVVPSQSAKEDYFLHVMQAVDANFSKDSPEVVADEAHLITTANRIGVEVDGWKILFDKSGTAEISVVHTDVKNEPKNDLDFRLDQNYPNPFNPSTEITYSLPVKARVNLTIHNILGQKIKTLVNDIQQAGIKNVNWNGLDNNGTNVASGVYFCKLEANDFISVRKMLLLP